MFEEIFLLLPKASGISYSSLNMLTVETVIQNKVHKSLQVILPLGTFDMEKSKSFPEYTAAYFGEFDFQERLNSYNFNMPTQKGSGFATSTNPEL
ncbi:hypothetical protein FF1_034162 [Malus domestica]|uniref:Uncharacterized protein n=1 Tax=Malus domestica TaxID=3750 RepID=A0A498K4H5_MALDO|nr:hypothetical protein DVH24_037760 [Malus domestica]